MIVERTCPQCASSFESDVETVRVAEALALDGTVLCATCCDAPGRIIQTRCIIVIPVRDTQIRQAITILHLEPDLHPIRRLACLRYLIQWAAETHDVHPTLPEYAGRSYLTKPIDTHGPLPTVLAALQEQGIEIRWETIRFDRQIGEQGTDGN